MTRQEQVQFVRDLSESITEEIVSNIDANKVPEDWDGHELRQLLAEKFIFNATKLAPQRMREYRNAVLVNNL